MSTTTARPQTLAEEIANAISHGIGFLLAVASLPILVLFSSGHGGATHVVGACVFSVTMMLLYLASAVYHALPQGRVKRWFQRVDHAAIFLFIAGSYTPFALGPLRGAWGWSLLAAVWSIAIVGIVAKALDRLAHPMWSTGLYVGMGWLVVVAIGPLVENMAAGGLVLLVAGGLAYTGGAVFYLLDSRMRFAHFVWHLFVIAGSVCHFFAALLHVA
ncbi:MULTISPECIES: hemolysin III family protein [unclassified Rubrivivax]|uniref:PAQR family membrane homeostasis protein TrhA n=1 Tax=unclassified Rubrivivax TaxID=2649762 RepID=UPI001E461E1F|nr:MULTISPECIES: hemolysin III family protein [unclassified Rubrivivax]MCC9596840.1 hemolysin III family protein [Rubrivivax sp. JA1055]MCC9648997.1 hemolysin III family protein [Rubrivivax sp. JA1029]